MRKWLFGLACIDLCLMLCCLVMLVAKACGGTKRINRIYVPASAEALSGKKKIALTFDDGPHPVYTEKLLDGLKERGVHATFFVTGEHAEQHPEIIRRMKEEGHLIGNHTYGHVQLRTDNLNQFKEELRKTNKIIQDVTGEEVLYVRPPYGSWDRSLEKELNMFPVLWTIDPTDWSCLSAETVTDRVVRKAKENAIILLHDYYGTSIEAALQIVDELQKEGYEFVTVDELLLE